MSWAELGALLLLVMAMFAGPLWLIERARRQERADESRSEALRRAAEARGWGFSAAWANLPEALAGLMVFGRSLSNSTSNVMEGVVDGRPVSVFEAHVFIGGRTTRDERSMVCVVCTPGVAAPHFFVKAAQKVADRLNPPKGSAPVAFSGDEAFSRAFTTFARGPVEAVQRCLPPEMRRRLAQVLAAGGTLECRGERVVLQRPGNFEVDALESLVADAMDLASRLASLA